jgi:DNA invertase Pin-like site-specific DNA recombinase
LESGFEGAKVWGVLVIYAPVSTDGASLWEYAYGRGWDDVRVLSDADVLLRAVRAGKVEVVLANSLIGMARSSLEFVAMLKDFVVHKTVLIVPGRINTSGVSSKVFLDVLDSIAEFKRVATVEAIHEGLAAAKARGIKLGRPRTLDAYHGDVARLRAQGLSGRGIARALGLPVGSVFGILRHLSDNSASSGAASQY